MDYVGRIGDRQFVAGGQRECAVLSCFYCRISVLHRVGRCSQLASVILLASVCGFDRDGLCGLRHGQFSVHGRDAVVAGHRSFIQRVSEGVLAVADFRLRSGHAVSRSLAGCESVTRYSHVAVRQRQTVVFLRVRRGRHRDASGRDAQIAVSCGLRSIVISCYCIATLNDIGVKVIFLPTVTYVLYLCVFCRGDR